jgi:hypothetical protein
MFNRIIFDSITRDNIVRNEDRGSVISESNDKGLHYPRLFAEIEDDLRHANTEEKNPTSLSAQNFFI